MENPWVYFKIYLALSELLEGCSIVDENPSKQPNQWNEKGNINTKQREKFLKDSCKDQSIDSFHLIQNHTEDFRFFLQ